LFRHPKQDTLYLEDFKRSIDTAFDDSFSAMVGEARATQLGNWIDNQYLNQRSRRFTKNGDELIRSQVICRSIFADKDLVEFILAVPPGFRLDRALFQLALIQLFNKMAKVPWAKTGYPITPCFRDLGLRFQQQFRWTLKSKGIPWVDLHRPRPYVDYNNWMRNSLRPWVEGTLLNKHSLARGYFNPDSIKNLVSEHMAGADYASKLGVLLTLELWHKKYLD